MPTPKTALPDMHKDAPLNILLLANRPSPNTNASTVIEYLDAFGRFSEHNIFEISMLGSFPEQIDLSRFDVVIIHYSLSLGPMIEHYLGKSLIDELIKFDGLKAAFLQDEYRQLKTYWNNIRQLGIDVIFSCVPDTEAHKVYPQSELPGIHVENVLTGYVSRELFAKNVPAISERPINVGYRSRKPPFWLGKLAFEKHYIADEFNARVKNTSLVTDISNEEGDRLYGERWTKFVMSCRAMLGTESGASIMDVDGSLEIAVDEYVAKNPDASFSEVSKLFLSSYEGNLKLNQISPRCFEAAALKTPMVLFEGEYSGILKPHEHYIPLKKDFSNFDEVVSLLKDQDYLQQIADRTFNEIALNEKYSYKRFIDLFDETINNHWSAEKKSRKAPYTHAEFNKNVNSAGLFGIKRQVALKLQSLILGVPWLRKSLFGLWYALPLSVQKQVRPLTKFISR